MADQSTDAFVPLERLEALERQLFPKIPDNAPARDLKAVVLEAIAARKAVNAEATALGAVWADIPPDTWVALHRAQGAMPPLDDRYSYWAEIGFKGDWRTGQCEGATPADAIRAAIVAAEGAKDA